MHDLVFIFVKRRAMDRQTHTHRHRDTGIENKNMNKPWLIGCWLLAQHSSNMLVYLRDGSAQTILGTATLGWK